MKAIVASLAALLVGCTHPLASECLDIVGVVGWSAKDYGNETEITLGLRNYGNQDVLMVDGTASFSDLLGNTVPPFPIALSPDIVIPANKPGNLMHLAHRGESRLSTISKDHVVPTVCVTRALLADGTVVQAVE